MFNIIRTVFLVIVGLLVLIIFWNGIKDFSALPSTLSDNESETDARDEEEDSIFRSTPPTTPPSQEEQIENLEDALEDAQERLLALTTSVYADEVTLSRGDAREYNPREEYVEIRASRDNTRAINITNWRIESQITDAWARIPQATNQPAVGDAPYLPAQDVWLAPGDVAYIVSGHSPINASFQTNICSGYWENTKTFYPSLNRSCPAPEDEIDLLLDFGIDVEEAREREREDRSETNDMRCLEEIEDVSTCEDPDYVPDREDDGVSRGCQDFFREIGYTMCVEQHMTDSDFLRGAWYIYLGRSFNDLWDDEDDTLSLLDASGDIVDQLSY